MGANRTLEDDGFAVVGHINISPEKQFVINFDAHPEAEWWECCLYAFRVGCEVIRIGRTQEVLHNRIREWMKDVTRALDGVFVPHHTSLDHAAFLRVVLKRRSGELLARRIEPTNVNLLRVQERVLIREFRPILCDDAPRRHI